MSRSVLTTGLGGLRPLTDRRVADLLDPDERAVLVVHPHWWRLLGASGGGAVGCVVAGLLTQLGSLPILNAVALIIVLSSVVWILVGAARWYFEVLVLTDRRVVFSRGVLARRTNEIPLKHVNDVRTEQGILGRLLNFGRVRIESGNAKGEELVTFIPAPERVRQELSRLTLDAQDRPSADASTRSPRPDLVAQLTQLSLLHAAHRLSDEEFARAKAQLLGGGETSDREDEA